MPESSAYILANRIPPVCEEHCLVVLSPVIERIFVPDMKHIKKGPPKRGPLFICLRLRTAKHEQQMHALTSEISAHEMFERLRRLHAVRGARLRHMNAPRGILEASATCQSHASPWPAIELHEPRSSLLVPKQFNHEHSPPSRVPDEVLNRLL